MGQDAASKRHHCRNTNVVHNCFGTMELTNKIKIYIRDNPESRVFFILGIIATIAVQFVIYNRYTDTIDFVDRFEKKEIKNELITNIRTRPFKPGRGTFRTIEINGDDKEEYPILLTGETDYDSEIVIGSGTTIYKESNSKEFKITKDSKEYKFRLMNIRDQMMTFMSITFVVTVGGTVFMIVMATLKKSTS